MQQHAGMPLVVILSALVVASNAPAFAHRRTIDNNVASGDLDDVPPPMTLTENKEFLKMHQRDFLESVRHDDWWLKLFRGYLKKWWGEARAANDQDFLQTLHEAEQLLS